MLCVEQLPDDPATLKRMLVERDSQLEVIHARHATEKEAAIRAAVAAEIQVAVDEAVQAAVAKAIKETTALFLRRFYGPRNERFDPRQLLLFGLKIDEMPLDEASVAEESHEELTTRRVAKRHKHGRRPLPDHLPRIDIEHDLDDAEKACPACGQLRERIGQEVSEQLEYLPASFKVLRHIRHKYGCRYCEHDGYNPQIATAAKPAQPIDKGLPGPGLLAYVAVSKLGDHLPLYRLEHIFARQNIQIARSTMCAWMQAAGELARPLVARMIERILLSRNIHTDDTPVPIQSPGEGKCRKGRIWAYIGDRENPYIVYDYTPNRSRAGPADWLRDFKGYLQADAYGGYDGIYHTGHVVEVACWAHARRKFFEAKETDGRRAAEMLSMVRELYAVEDEAKELDDAARRELRQAQSVPILASIKAWLDAEQQVVLPRSAMGQAIQYALNQWDALCVYATEGFLAIDNNAAERAMKRVAIGRKNWLFAGNDRAGETTALLYSLIASAERHGLDPQRYLTSVFANLPFTPEEELQQFLPDVWKRDDAAELPIDR
jgi:transposase